jgi:predicted glycosyltransferase
VNILIDIGHPAHVHYFRNLYFELVKNHKVTVTCKSVPIIIQLLNHYKIEFTELGSKGKGIFGKLFRQFRFISKILTIMKQQKIDLAIGVSASVVQAALFCKTKSILFDDDDLDVQPLARWFVTPFADCILSPDTLSFEQLRKAVYYPGYHELAYLHPNRFTPDPTVLQKYGITENDKYFILRFNAFTAHHDIGKGGMNLDQKRKLIRLLSGHGKVFVTSEQVLEPEFEPFRCPVASYEMHFFLNYAAMLVSDSQTMTSEAAMLGVPSLRCNSFAGKISYLEEEEKKYGLTYAFPPSEFDLMLQKISEMLVENNLKQQWVEKRNKMFAEKIDVTPFWLWFIENYPASVNDVRDPVFSYDRFR